MADDSNLIEFNLQDENSASSTSESVTSENLTSKNTATIDNKTERHIDAIIVNVTGKGLTAPAMTLISRYWKPCLVQCANEYGLDSVHWRDSVKKLTNLSLYLDPEVKKDYPQIETKLLPALLNEMKQQISDRNVADDELNAVLDGLQNKVTTTATNVTSTVTKTAIIAEQVANSVEPKPTPETLESSLTTDVSEQSEIAEFELDATDSFDLDLSLEAETATTQEAIEPLEFELPQESIAKTADVKEEMATATITTKLESKPMDLDDLPPLDLEPFKDDT